MINRIALAAPALVLAAGTASAGNIVGVIGGQTNVLLDTETLSAVGLDLSSVSDDVIAPGNLGDDSVAFPINPRDGNLPTTFSYDPADFLGSFSGTIEHTGLVRFNADAVTVGDFTIGFDAARAVGNNSGFFVESTNGIEAILFDIEAPSQLDPGEETLVIAANLLVSPEFAAFLGDETLTGADVGDALVEANVPAPAAAALLACGGLAATRRRR